MPILNVCKKRKKELIVNTDILVKFSEQNRFKKLKAKLSINTKFLMGKKKKEKKKTGFTMCIV